jgi:hypothetical protein
MVITLTIITTTMKKKEINQICPYRGVTVSQLLDQAEYLIRTIPASYQLDDHQKQTAINDAVMYVWNKMEANEVDKYDYPKFKDYLFVSLKNQLIKEGEKDKQKRYQPVINSIDSHDLKDTHYEPYTTNEQDQIDTRTQMAILAKYINQLSDKDRKAIQTFLATNYANVSFSSHQYFKDLMKRIKATIAKTRKIDRLNQIADEIIAKHKKKKKIQDINDKPLTPVIRMMLDAKLPRPFIIQKLGVSRQLVEQTVRKYGYHQPKQKVEKDTSKYQYLKAKYEDIYNEWISGTSKYKLAKKYGTTQPSITYAIQSYQRKLDGQNNTDEQK